MRNEKVWILSDKNSKTLTHILVRIYFAQEYQSEIQIYDDINTIEELKDFNLEFENQIIYYAFENVLMAEFIRNECKEKNIKYFDIYAVVYNYIAGLFAKISRGDSIKTVLEKSLENNPVDFTLSNDDGSNPKSIIESDIVIIGVSRTSKTPLSIYMSNHGYRVTNIPLVPEIDLPRELHAIDSNRIFALVMDPERLVEIRKERIKSLGLPMDSGYATLERVVQEIEYSHHVIKKLNCRSIDVTHISIEEASEKIRNFIDTRKEF